MISAQLAGVSYDFEVKDSAPRKKVLTQSLITLEDTKKPRPLAKKYTATQKEHYTPARSMSSQNLNSKFSSLTGKELQKVLDTELKKAQDLVDTEDSENILKAKTMLEQILKKNPNHNESLKELAMIYMYDLDNSMKAEEYMVELMSKAQILQFLLRLFSWQNRMAI